MKCKHQFIKMHDRGQDEIKVCCPLCGEIRTVSPLGNINLIVDGKPVDDNLRPILVVLEDDDETKD